MGKALRTLNFETQVIKAMLAMIYNKGKVMDEPAYNECERLRARIAEQKLRLEVHMRDEAALRAEVERLKGTGMKPTSYDELDNKALRAEVERLKDLDVAWLNAEGKISDLEAEVERLKGPLHSPERYEECERLRARIAELEDENAAFVGPLQARITELEGALGRIIDTHYGKYDGNWLPAIEAGRSALSQEKK